MVDYSFLILILKKWLLLMIKNCIGVLPKVPGVGVWFHTVLTILKDSQVMMMMIQFLVCWRSKLCTPSKYLWLLYQSSWAWSTSQKTGWWTKWQQWWWLIFINVLLQLCIFVVKYLLSEKITIMYSSHVTKTFGYKYPSGNYPKFFNNKIIISCYIDL